jgi:hypothetical protein
VKGGATRVVPLHEQLVAQGFLKFVAEHRDGPLFYKTDKSAPSADLIKRKKPRYAQARQRLPINRGSSSAAMIDVVKLIWASLSASVPPRSATCPAIRSR